MLAGAVSPFGAAGAPAWGTASRAAALVRTKTRITVCTVGQRCSCSGPTRQHTGTVGETLQRPTRTQTHKALNSMQSINTVNAQVIYYRTISGFESGTSTLYASANQAVSDAFSSIRVVQAYNLQDQVRNRVPLMRAKRLMAAAVSSGHAFSVRAACYGLGGAGLQPAGPGAEQAWPHCSSLTMCFLPRAPLLDACRPPGPGLAQPCNIPIGTSTLLFPC